MLYYNRPFPIVYKVNETSFKGYMNIIAGFQVLIYKNPLNPPEILEMTQKDDQWQALYTLSDTTVKMILIAFQAKDSLGLRYDKLVDNNNGEYWDVLVQAGGIPVKGAHQARALSYSGMGGTRTKNPKRAYEEIKKEIKLYPNNLSARTLLYSILLSLRVDDYDIKRDIEREIDSILDERPDQESVMNFAITGYRMIGETDKAQKIESDLIQRNPGGHQAAMNTLNQIMEMEDTETRTQSLENFLVEFPESRLIEFALYGLATATIELDDSTKMIDIGDKLMEKATTPNAASGLAGIAGVLSEKMFQLSRASAYAEKALVLTRSAKSSTPPSGFSPEEWEQQLNATEARYRDILGWIYVQQGRLNQGLDELREAVKGTSQPGVYYHLASALERSGTEDEALLNYARAVAFGGEIGDLAYQSFYDLWLRAERDTTEITAFIERETEWIKNNFEKRILSQRAVRPAPDFELEDMDGAWVRLSDQKESIVLLCFWATWSQSSWEMLKDIHDLARTYGQDVLFLTIATDMEYDKIEDYVRKRRLFLPVLLNDGTDQDYQLQGVPTVFVIDEKRNIHFEHKGYQPQIKEMLTVELEDLMSAQNK